MTVTFLQLTFQQAKEESQEGALKITEDQLINVRREASEENITHDGEIDSIEYRIIVERTTRNEKFRIENNTFVSK